MPVMRGGPSSSGCWTARRGWARAVTPPTDASRGAPDSSTAASAWRSAAVRSWSVPGGLKEAPDLALQRARDEEREEEGEREEAEQDRRGDDPRLADLRADLRVRAEHGDTHLRALEARHLEGRRAVLLAGDLHRPPL